LPFSLLTEPCQFYLLLSCLREKELGRRTDEGILKRLSPVSQSFRAYKLMFKPIPVSILVISNCSNNTKDNCFCEALTCKKEGKEVCEVRIGFGPFCSLKYLINSDVFHSKDLKA